MIWDGWFGDPNVAIGGNVYALTIITAIRTGSEAALTAHLRAIGQEASPFRRLPSTHFARLVVLDELARMPDLERQHLLFSAVIDGNSTDARDEYLEELARRIPRQVNAIWGACAGAPLPPAEKPQRFADWMARHQVKTRAFYAHYDGPVERVRRALRVHEEVRRFAARAQYLTARDLKERVAARAEDWRE